MGIQKVSAFVVAGKNMLVFRHPLAGIQLPAGTVEPDETFQQAAVREVREETGIEVELDSAVFLGSKSSDLPDGWAIMNTTWTPPKDSGDILKRGHKVKIVEEVPDGTVRVEEHIYHFDKDAPAIAQKLCGKVPAELLSTEVSRAFILFRARSHMNSIHESWQREADGHIFEVFWVDRSQADLVPGQDVWLAEYADAIDEALRESNWS